MRIRSYIAVAVALLGLASSVAATTAIAKRRPKPWTCNGQQVTCDKRFDHVVLPATHNSMSAKSRGFAIPNQPLGIPRQLSLGIRGFLWDAYYAHRDQSGRLVTDTQGKEPGDSLYLCHESCANGATPLDETLRTLKNFIQRHPHEVFLIDTEDYVTPADYVDAFRRTDLARYVYRGRPGPRWPTLRTMISKRQQVVVLAEHHAGGAPWYHLDYDGIVQETSYTYYRETDLTDPANWKASCAPNRGGRRGSLFLMNHWSPPVGSHAASAQRINSFKVLVGRAKECRKVRGLLPTIIAVDQFTSGALVRAARALNRL